MNFIMKIIFLLFFIGVMPSLVCAQNVNIKNKFTPLTTAEMIQLFKDRKIAKEHVFDKMYVPGYFYEPSLVYPSPLQELAPSYMGLWRIPRRDCKYLFLESITPHSADSLAQASSKFLQIKKSYKKKGTIPLCPNIPANYNGVIASWFSGHIFVLHCPKKLFNTIVSKKADFLNIKEGILKEENKIASEVGEYESSCFQQENGLIYIREDGCWYDDIKRNIEYSISPLINKDFPKAFAKYSGKEYVFLLEIEPETKRIIPHVLLPETLDASDYKIISYLKGQTKKMPANSFGPLITINQKLLYGRYFKFIIDNNKFKVKDFLDD